MTDRTKFWDLVEDVETCMMVTNPPGGCMRARPMHAIPYREDGEIWFYTKLDSGKSAELAENGEVCLCFARPAGSDYVSVTGNAEVVRDSARVHENWSRFVDCWFDNGPDGEDVGMIRVRPEQAEYWDQQSSEVLAALKMALASARDDTPDLGEHRKVAL